VLAGGEPPELSEGGRPEAEKAAACHRSAFSEPDVTPCQTLVLTASVVVVAGLLDPDWKVEIEAEATLDA